MRLLPNTIRKGLGLLVPVAAILAGFLVFVWNPVPVQILRNATFDHFQRWHPRIYQEVPVRIIDIDEESLRRLGQWPWPRTRIAELVSMLQGYGAAVIAFDVIFAEPDRTSPAAMLELWRASPSLRRQLDHLPDHDAVLTTIIQRGNVVLGFAIEQEGVAHEVPDVKARYVVSGDPPQPYVHAFTRAIPSLPKLESAAAGNGALAFFADADGVVRKAPLVLRMGETLLPSLTAEALRVAQNARNYTIRTHPKNIGLAEIRIGNLVLPTTPEGELWIHYTKSTASRYIPVWKILSGEVAANELANGILLVGSSAQGLMDLRFSPMGGVIPGVEVHAQLLEQILTGSGLARPSWAGASEALIIVLGGLLVGGVALSAGAMVSLSFFTFLIVLLWFSAWQAFVTNGLLIDACNTSIALAVTYVLSSIVRHLSIERRQRWVRQAFSRYVSPNLVTHLIEHPEALELGGHRQSCSFVFTDLTGFTTLMERLDPTEAVAVLNAYLDRMIAIAFLHQGTLDRIVGDAVAIMFSAPVVQPDHQRRALSCALAMQRFARQYANELQAKGIGFGQTRIGIHSGEVTVGNFGGSTIFDYRALGDPVNTASRLEAANKYLGTLTCVSEATLAGCPEWPVRPIGRIILKGKSQAIEVFEPLDPLEANGSDADYQHAFDLLRAKALAARQAFATLAAQRPGDQLVAFHLARLDSGNTGDLIVMAEK